VNPRADRRGAQPTPLQIWQAGFADLLGDARVELDARAWRVFLEVILTRVVHEVTEADVDAWRRAA
jgi:hypothetical protein